MRMRRGAQAKEAAEAWRRRPSLMGGLSPWVLVSSGTEITGFLLCQFFMQPREAFQEEGASLTVAMERMERSLGMSLSPRILGGVAFSGLMTQHLLPSSPLIPSPCWRETGQDKQIWTEVWLSGPVAPGVGSKTASSRGPSESRPRFALQGCPSALQPRSRALTLLPMITPCARQQTRHNMCRLFQSS